MKSTKIGGGEWEVRVRAYLLVADASESTIAAVIGYARAYGTVEHLGLEPEIRDAVEALLPWAPDDEWDRHDGTWATAGIPCQV